MSEEKNEKQYRTEWSFSFENLGKRFNDMLGSVSDQEPTTETFEADLAGATSARVHVGLSIGQATVRALPPSDKLIQAELTHLGEAVFEVSGETERRVTLRPRTSPDTVVGGIRRAIGSLRGRVDLRWNVMLSPDVPMNLELHGGVGPADIDLTGLQLQRLEFDGGVGETHITLPVRDIPVEIEGGVGQVTITVPRDASPRMDIEGGVGQVRLNLPADAAVRVEVEGGLGSADMPPAFSRVKGGEGFMERGGVWETSGYAMAQKQIVIKYEGGIGNLQVRMQE